MNTSGPVSRVLPEGRWPMRTLIALFVCLTASSALLGGRSELSRRQGDPDRRRGRLGLPDRRSRDASSLRVARDQDRRRRRRERQDRRRDHRHARRARHRARPRARPRIHEQRPGELIDDRRPQDAEAARAPSRPGRIPTASATCRIARKSGRSTTRADRSRRSTRCRPRSSRRSRSEARSRKRSRTRPPIACTSTSRTRVRSRSSTRSRTRSSRRGRSPAAKVRPGLAFDAKNHLLLSACDGKMAVTDSRSGKAVTSFPIADRVDGNGFDAGNRAGVRLERHRRRDDRARGRAGQVHGRPDGEDAALRPDDVARSDDAPRLRAGGVDDAGANGRPQITPGTMKVLVLGMEP